MNRILSFKKLSFKVDLYGWLFFIISISLYEVFLGGGGRFVVIGPLTLRMYLFFFLLGLGFVYIIAKGKIDKTILSLFLFFIFTVIISATIGIVNNAEIGYIFEDTKPLLYFLSILYLYQVITVENIPKIIRIIKYSGFILAIVYCLLLISIFFQYLNFVQFYNAISVYGEVMFRGSEGLFFYKGFLYLNIAFFFYFLSKSKKSQIVSFFIAAAILLTLTRGFFLSLGISLFFYYVFLNKSIVKKLSFLLLTIVLIVVYFAFIVPHLGDRSISNSDRIVQIKQVMESTTVFSFFLGHGFGIGVPIRPVHMEISYLEIFHKQGLLGLAFWSTLFVIITFYYFKIRSSEYKYIADTFYLGTFFIYIQTFTNPFLNNPIGMTFVIITLLVFKTIYQHKKNDLGMYSHV